MTAVPPQEPFDFLPLKSSQIRRHLDGIDEENHSDRRIGLGGNSIVLVKKEMIVCGWPLSSEAKCSRPRLEIGFPKLLVTTTSRLNEAQQEVRHARATLSESW